MLIIMNFTILVLFKSRHIRRNKDSGCTGSSDVM